MARFLLEFCLLAILSFLINSPAAADEWWEYGHFYQIYPRSFQDSDGDGVGDLNGITMRLDYLKMIGVTGVWLSPIMASPMADFGYDISDYYKIQPEYGTMDDFDRLVEKCKRLDIKLILDFVPNHSSDQHDWFKKSSDPTHAEYEKYKDYYIWNNGTMVDGVRKPPSNWISIFRRSAWTWVEKRQAFYLHQFLEEQPDLNYRNSALVNEMKAILKFWLDKGVSGFRCDAVPYLFEVEVNDNGLYEDEPLSGQCTNDPEAYCYLTHNCTSDIDETFDMIYQWREVTDTYTDLKRILMTEAYTSLPNTLRFYGVTNTSGYVIKYGSQIPFNFELISKTSFSSTANDFKVNIDNWMNGMPKGTGIHANWVMGNHDNKRLASRYGPARADLFNILLKTLPGITVTYNGEELALTDVFLTWDQTKDPQACRTNKNDYHTVSRDPARTPFQWDSTKNSGFSLADETWLPVAENYTKNNVELQLEQPFSHLNLFRRLINLRENPTMKYGKMDIQAIDSDLLVYKREMANGAGDVFLIILNLGGTEKAVNLTDNFQNLPTKMTIKVISTHAEKHKAGDTIETKTTKVTAEPNIGMVLMGTK